MTRRRILIALGIVLVVVAGSAGPFIVTVTDKSKPELQTPVLDSASDAVNHFMSSYVNADGRVARHDQGDDTVSEGQADALLLAVATKDQTRFDSIWNWTSSNLLQSNGLMARHWQSGKVVDPASDSDADLDATRALVVASRKFNAPKYANQAKRMANAILQNEVVHTAKGNSLLLAGTWAKSVPYVVNPSDESPRDEQEIAQLAGSSEWTSLLQNQRQTVDQLIGTNSKLLPPDWASIDQSDNAKAAPAPNTTDAAVYSTDAARLPVRLAESCDPTDQSQALRMWSVLNRSRDSRAAQAMSLSGSIKNKSQVSLSAVASAAGAKAGKDSLQTDNLLNLADQLEASKTTFAGAAWSALGRVMLTTDWLGTC